MTAGTEQWVAPAARKLQERPGSEVRKWLPKEQTRSIGAARLAELRKVA
jgi:hypothetical protein